MEDCKMNQETCLQIFLLELFEELVYVEVLHGDRKDLNAECVLDETFVDK